MAKAGTTFGNGMIYRALIRLLRHTDVRIPYAFMAVFIIPFTLLLSPGARLTYEYYHRIKGHKMLASIWLTYCNHVVFGKTVIDKFAMYAGHQFKVNYYGKEYYQDLTARPEAVVQLSAHVGCSEIVGYTYDNEKKLNALVFGGENSAMMGYRKSAFGNKNIEMIPVGATENHSDKIISALDKGEMVCLFADRFMSSNKIVYATLHGHKIRLAKGPFSLAVTRGLDVVMANAMKEADGSYSAYFTPLYYNKNATPKDQRRQLADAYVGEVEKLLEKYPLQWFNYSNVWEDL